MPKFNFSTLPEVEPGLTTNPYAGRTEAGDWLPGLISIGFLQEHFGHLSTASEMQAATDSEGLKLYFGWLVDQGKIPQ